MKENIETKDVQRTEYLDKNGLDMLWAKVKENTHNQVEVERNRAVAKEDNITNSLSEFASKTTADAQYFRAIVSSYDTIGTFSKEYGLGTAFLSDYSGDPRLTIRNPRRMDNKTILTASSLFITSYYGTQIAISADGVQMSQKTTKDIVTANNSTAHIGLDDDQTEYTYVTPLENGKVPAEYLDLSQYAKKTDIPAVDTSDFVSKTTTDAQIINSPLCINNEVVIADNMEDENADFIGLTPTELQFGENNYISSINLRGKAMDFDIESSIEIKTSHENPCITLYSGTKGTNTDESSLEITNSGISINSSQNENSGPDKVFATDGSIADLAQYVKKGEITAGGNVDDVQINGVSVIENKIANIKPATKEEFGVIKVGDGINVTDGIISVSAGNCLTYDKVLNETNYYFSPHKTFTFEGDNLHSTTHIGEMVGVFNSSNAYMYSKMLDNYIELRAGENALNISCANISGNEYKGDDPTPNNQFVLNKRGVWLYGGDNNHVLTSNASTIDITQYVLKSVYDEKIATLEARIAALEALSIPKLLNEIKK